MKKWYYFKSKMSPKGNTIVIMSSSPAGEKKARLVTIGDKQYEVAGQSLFADNKVEFSYGILKGKQDLSFKLGDLVGEFDPNEGRAF